MSRKHTAKILGTFEGVSACAAGVYILQVLELCSSCMNNVLSKHTLPEGKKHCNGVLMHKGFGGVLEQRGYIGVQQSIW